MDLNDTTGMILKSFNASFQGVKLYPPGHPSLIAPARKTFNLIDQKFTENPKIFISYIDDSLIFEDMPVMDGEEHFQDIINVFIKLEIETIIFEKGLQEKEVINLIELLTRENPPKGNSLQKELTNLGIKYISLKSLQLTTGKFLKVYNDAIEIVKNVLNETRMGKIPKTDAIDHIVDDMSELVFEDQSAMLGLTMIKDYDDYLYNHSVNVGILSLSIGKELKLSTEDLHATGVGGMLHDIGKTGVAEDIIRKPGGLSSEEWKKIQEHPVLGERIAKRMVGLPELSKKAIHEHHIRFDKSGYPKIEIDEINIVSSIVCIADAYDALTTLRVYQKPYQPAEALKIIRGLSGKHFDPKVVEALISLLGVYPIGTLVRLSTNELSIVTKVNHEDGERPQVKIIIGPQGAELPEPFNIDLTQSSDTTRKIIAPVDPLTKQIDLSKFFTEEAANN